MSIYVLFQTYIRKSMIRSRSNDKYKQYKSLQLTGKYVAINFRQIFCLLLNNRICNKSDQLNIKILEDDAIDISGTANKYWSQLKMLKSATFTLGYTSRKSLVQCRKQMPNCLCQKILTIGFMVLRVETATRLGDNRELFRLLHKATIDRERRK